ncbi:MAG: lysophospholipase [Weeksellaceae bacterium]|nr:lysophospholipase [Weeksellaceae bacterium]
MKKIFRKMFYGIISIVATAFILGLIVSCHPTTKSKISNQGITPEEAATLRQPYKGSHQVFKTSGGTKLFMRVWKPDSIAAAKKDMAVLIFHGFAAHSGAYSAAGKSFSAGGYMTFGLDYRAHGLSDGNRGDSPGKKTWIEDLAESVKYVKSWGYSKVIVLGHSLGVAAAICVTDAVPNDVSGLILLSSAFESRKSNAKSSSFFQRAKILSNAVFRPSYQSIEYNRDGLVISKDILYNYRYTLRFVTMLAEESTMKHQNLSTLYFNT